VDDMGPLFLFVETAVGLCDDEEPTNPFEFKI
jgi:hypothetical protein